MNDMSNRALEGIRVLDFGQYLAGPLVAMMLADQGAEVIRIDPPGGPRWDTPANAVLQRGKRSIVLDLKSPTDRVSAQSLCTTADILIENFRPGTMARLGLDERSLRKRNPALIYCSMPGFPKADPRAKLPGWEGIVSAAAGLYTPYAATRTDISGAGTAPAFTAIPIASNFAAFVAVNAIMAALIARSRSGKGQTIEASLFGAAFEAMNIEAQKGPLPSRNPFHAAADNRFCCSDGIWIQLLLLSPRHLDRFVAHFLPGLAREGLGDALRLQREPSAGERVRVALQSLFSSRPADEWDRAVNAIGVPLTICRSTDDFLLHDAQAEVTDAVIDLDDPLLGRTKQLGYPVMLSRTPPCCTGARALPGSTHPDALPAHTPLATHGEVPVLEDGEPPLKGFRIVDMSQVLAAPSGVRVLAELGAEVIKINPPEGWLIGHLQFNSGKRSVLLDIANADGRDALLRLMKGADILAHNLGVESATRFGLDEAAIRRLQPDIIYATVSAYGGRGERAAYRGWEPIGQASTGMQLRLGDGIPTMARFPLCDFGTGQLFAFAMLLGLWHRLRTGQGQHVQASLMHTGAYHQAPYMLSYQGQQRREPRGLAARGFAATDRLYRASDRWLYCRASTFAEFDVVEGLSGISSTPDPEAALEQAFRTTRADVWTSRLLHARIPAHTLQNLPVVMEDSRVIGQFFSIERTHSHFGAVRTIGPVYAMSPNPALIVPLAPLPGTDSHPVLSEWIGLAEADQLLASQAASNSLPPDQMVVW
jgi:crotonobetainyl-CoA:carnitine CoA-transferase CaiB-like acyl-CoA transferase